MKLRCGCEGAAAQLQRGAEQWYEFGRKCELAVGWMPTRGENDDATFADRNFDDCGIAIVKLGDDARSRKQRRVHAPVFPEMNLGEIAETCVGERREERVAKINLAQHRVILR